MNRNSVIPAFLFYFKVAINDGTFDSYLFL